VLTNNDIDLNDIPSSVISQACLCYASPPSTTTIIYATLTQTTLTPTTITDVVTISSTSVLLTTTTSTLTVASASLGNPYLLAEGPENACVSDTDADLTFSAATSFGDVLSQCANDCSDNNCVEFVVGFSVSQNSWLCFV
jgi:hypothetical protein